MDELLYYNNEVDNILADLIGPNPFAEEDLDALVESISNTIIQYDKKNDKKQLYRIVYLIVLAKYKKCYVYNFDASLNNVIQKKNKKKSDSMSIDLSDMDNLSENSECKSNYLNSELKDTKNDKIILSNATDLVSHRHDYPLDKYNDNKYLIRYKRICQLKKIPQHEQKSIEWLKQRNECLTATAIATVLDEDPYKFPAELLLDKCGRGKPFVENEYVHHGKKYEQIGNLFYGYRNNIQVAEYGLLQHEKYSFIGASPDGICEKQTLQSDNLSKLVGRLLEIKFPKSRKIITGGAIDGDICPHYYYIQVLTQLYVTGLDECDFLQCKIDEYDSWEDFVKDSHPKIQGLSKTTNLEKGCLIQLLPKKMVGSDDPKMCLYNAKYIYPPKMHMTHDEIKNWISDEIMHYHSSNLSVDYIIDRIIYWRLSQVTCHLIKSNHDFFKSKIPLLKQFWAYVEFYRQHPKKLDRLEDFIKEVGNKKSAQIFEKVHKDYQTLYPETLYKPLYQEENSWRIKFNKKSESYQKFLSYKNRKENTIN